jgi:WD40 repeat protein
VSFIFLEPLSLGLTERGETAPGEISMLLLRGHTGPINALLYAPGDPATLASASSDGTVKLWNPGTGRAWATFRGRSAAGALAFSPDGTTLAARDPLDWTAVSLWDVALERQKATLWMIRASEVAAVAFLPDGTGLLVGSRNLELGGSGLLEWFRLPEREVVAFRPWRGGVECLAFSPDGRLLAVAGHRRYAVELVNMDEELQPRRPVWWFQSPVRSLAFAPVDGRTLAVAAGRGVQFWDVEKGKKRAVLKGHRGDVQSIAFSPDGRLLVSGGRDRTVRLWDVTCGKERACFDWQVGRVHAVAFAPDGMTAAAGGETPDIVVWDVEGDPGCSAGTGW